MKKTTPLSALFLFTVLILSCLALNCSNSNERSSSGPDPIFEKPDPITMEELRGKAIQGVQAYEVTDYGPAHYKEKIPNVKPHADHNPHRAVLIKWQEYPTQTFVFNHEASYTPWMEVPSGLGLCSQFFEGNDGWAELFNENGRKERNSFVDVVRSGLEKVWVRWNYFCVNVKSDSLPALRGTEDYVAYPNGLLWRRLTYTSLMPESRFGYSWQPIDYFAVAPNGTEWKDLFPKDQEHNDYFISSVLDIYSDRQYDIFWDDSGKARRNGSDQLLWDISKSRGIAMVMTSKEGYLFVLFGPSSGFPAEKNQIVDHSFNGTGGWGWNAVRWDHWPVGWVNAQTREYEPGSPYPYHFGPLSHFWVSSRITKPADYGKNVQDMEHNRWSEKHVYYTLNGVAKDLQTVREIGRKWLDKGNACAAPESIRDLR